MRLKELRLNSNLTQAQLAEKIGCLQSAVGKYERGDLQPGIETLCKLADTFGCTIDYLLNREDNLGNISTNTKLNEQEKEMLSMFNSLSDDRKQTTITLLHYLSNKEN